MENQDNIVFCCEECGVGIIRDSKSHDESVTNDEGKQWWCGDCCMLCPNNKIYVLSDGEQWSFGGEIREADIDDEQLYGEYGVEVGDMICVLDNGDMECSDDGLYEIYVSDQELEDIENGLEPRKIDGYYERVTSV